MSEFDDQHEPGQVTIESKGSAAEQEQARTGRLDEIASSMKEFAHRIPDSINRAIETAQSALQARANAITIHVDDEAQRRIDQLVEAGVFKSRSESAAFLIYEGIRSRQDMFNNISSKVAEINRLRTEMRALVANEGNTDEDTI